jgi:hypothetical protein
MALSSIEMAIARDAVFLSSVARIALVPMHLIPNRRTSAPSRRSRACTEPGGKGDATNAGHTD